MRRPDGEQSTSKELEGGNVFVSKFDFWVLKREESTVKSGLADRSTEVCASYIFPSWVFKLARVNEMGRVFSSGEA